MTDENTQEQPNPADKGLPPGVTTEVTGNGEDRAAGAPQPPEVRNTPPEDKAKIAEAEKAAADQKAKDEAAAKEEADKKAAEQEADTSEDSEVLTEYPTYGDEAADAVVAMLKEAEVSPVDADKWFREAVKTGDLTKIDMKAITEKLGKEKANLVLIGVKDYYTRMNAAVQATVTAVHTEVGGEGNWTKIGEWASKKANTDKGFAEQLAEFNKMFDLSPTAAKSAARELKSLYEKDSGNKSLNTKIVEGDSTASGGVGGEKLSRQEYLTKAKAAWDRGDYAEYNALRAQRAASK